MIQVVPDSSLHTALTSSRVKTTGSFFGFFARTTSSSHPMSAERNTGAVAFYQRLGFRAERALWHGGRQLWLTLSLPTP
jgi:hypothetical protein